MAYQGISTGTTPNDGTGDSLLAGAIKINNNFGEVYNAIGDGSDLLVSTIGSGTSIAFDSNIIPLTNNTRNLGATSNKWNVIHGNEFTGDTYFTQVGTGAITRTVQDKLEDVVSVLDFGADPTGVADSSDAIQAAINSIEPGATTPSYGTIYFPPGTYYVTKTIYVRGGGVHLLGAGIESTIIRRTDGGAYGPTILLSNNMTEYGGIRKNNNSISYMTLYDTVAATSNCHILSTFQNELKLKSLTLWNPYVGIRANFTQFTYDDITVEYDNTLYTTTTSPITNSIGKAAFWFEANQNNASNSGRVFHSQSIIRQSPHLGYPAEYGFLINSMDGIFITACYVRAASKHAYSIWPESSQGAIDNNSTNTPRATGVKMSSCWADWPGEVAVLIQNPKNGNCGSHDITNFGHYAGTSSTEATAYGLVVGNADGNTTGGLTNNVTASQFKSNNCRKSAIELRKQSNNVNITSPQCWNASKGAVGLDPTVNVKGGVSNWSIVGGNLDSDGEDGNSSASVGVRIRPGSSDNYKIVGVGVTRCQTDVGVVDEGTGTNKTILDYFTQVGTGAETRTVQDKLEDVVSVLDFIPPGTNTKTTNCTIWVQAAINAAANKRLYIPAGTYLVNANLTISSPITLSGDGIGKSVLKRSLVTGDTIHFFELSAQNITIEQLTLDSTLTGQTTGIMDNLFLASDVSGLRVDQVEFTANLLENAAKSKGIQLDAAVEANHCTITNCIFRHQRFSIVSPNEFGTSGNRARYWTVSQCHFYTCNLACTFNSDFATSGVTDAWIDVKVLDCYVIGMPTVTYGRVTAMGGDSCKRLTIKGCTFIDRAGQDDCVIHIENYFDDVLISDNTFYNCAGGIVVYPLSSRVVISNNVITLDPTITSTPPAAQAPSSFSNLGISVISDNDGVANDVQIIGNSITGAGIGPGIYLASNKDNVHVVSDNRVKWCASGLALRVQSRDCVINDNAFTECGNGLDVSVSSNFVEYGGRNQQFMNCTNVFTNYNSTDMPLILDCPSIKGIVSHNGGGVVRSFPIMPTPLLVNGKCDIFIKRDGNYNPMYAATANIQIDDAPTFTAAREGKIRFTTTVAVSDPVFNDNAGTLQLRLYSNDAIDLFYEIALRGYVYFSLQ